MQNRFACCNGRDMTSRCAASFQKLKFNTKHTIYSTFLQLCSFKFVLLIQIRGHAVTYRSAVGHTVSRDANSQARVQAAVTLHFSLHWLPFIRMRMRQTGNASPCEKFSHFAAFQSSNLVNSGLRIRITWYHVTNGRSIRHSMTFYLN